MKRGDKRLRGLLIVALNSAIAAEMIALQAGGQILERWDELIAKEQTS